MQEGKFLLSMKKEEKREKLAVTKLYRGEKTRWLQVPLTYYAKGGGETITGGGSGLCQHITGSKGSRAKKAGRVQEYRIDWRRRWGSGNVTS